MRVNFFGFKKYSYNKYCDFEYKLKNFITATVIKFLLTKSYSLLCKFVW